MIVVVGGLKGGSGKITVALHLAIMRVAQGHDVLVIDADDQETTFDFTRLRNTRTGNHAGYTCVKLTGLALRIDTLRLADKYDDIVIDTGGRDTTSQRAALAVADRLLVPFLPRSFDVWTLEKMVALIEDMRSANPTLLAYAFLNRADPRGQDNAQAAEVLRETSALHFLQTPLGTRKAFGNAASHGRAVTELTPHDPKAVHEISTLFHHVFPVSQRSTLEEPLP